MQKKKKGEGHLKKIGDRLPKQKQNNHSQNENIEKGEKLLVLKQDRTKGNPIWVLLILWMVRPVFEEFSWQLKTVFKAQPARSFKKFFQGYS